MALVAPSLLSADFANLQRDIEMINCSETDWLHLDIMDGVFVPNISFGFPVLKEVRKHCTKLLDAHLMIVEPMKFVEEVKECGCDVMTIHIEAVHHLDRAIHQIQDAGMKAGVALNPHTPVSLLEEVIDLADVIMLMSVNPGFGNQKFIEYSVAKVAKVKELILRRNAATLIEVDGGVNLETGRRLIDAGADVLVAGSFVFGSPNPLKTIAELKRL